MIDKDLSIIFGAIELISKLPGTGITEFPATVLQIYFPTHFTQSVGNSTNCNNNYNYKYGKDCRMLTGITMMMIVLLMKACIESSRDISFVFFLFWITTEGIYLQQFTTIVIIPAFIYYYELFRD